MSIFPPDMKPNGNGTSLARKPKTNEERILNEIRIFMFIGLLLVAAIALMQYKIYLRTSSVREFSLWSSMPYMKINEVSGKVTRLDDELVDFARRGRKVESVTRVGTSDNFDVVVSSEFNEKVDRQIQATKKQIQK